METYATMKAIKALKARFEELRREEGRKATDFLGDLSEEDIRGARHKGIAFGIAADLVQDLISDLNRLDPNVE